MVRRVTGPGRTGDTRACALTLCECACPCVSHETIDTLRMLTQVLAGRAFDLVPLPRSRFPCGTLAQSSCPSKLVDLRCCGAGAAEAGQWEEELGWLVCGSQLHGGQAKGDARMHKARIRFYTWNMMAKPKRCRQRPGVAIAVSCSRGRCKCQNLESI